MTQSVSSAELELRTPRVIARIDEAHCIGCTLCIRVCPVDAIAGARGVLHTVIAAQCTGCALCLPPCPVDCIALLARPAERAHWSEQDAGEARMRFDARNARLARQAAARGRRPVRARDRDRRRAVIAAAIERARRARAARRKP